MMQHLLDIAQLSTQDLREIIELAQSYKKNNQWPPLLKNKWVGLLFFEPSTRTRNAFQIAARQLGAEVLAPDINLSSVSKGETIIDTIENLLAMGVRYFVVRHHENGIPQTLSEHFKDRIHLINAGDGTHAHPTQALIDAMTIVEKFPDPQALKITIVGDIHHSRVTNSLLEVYKKLGISRVCLVAPKIFQPTSRKEAHDFPVTEDIVTGLQDADIVVSLRIQKERLSGFVPDLDEFHQQYGVTEERLKLAKPNAWVMHPGPMNRNVEIASSVADGKQSLILLQSHNSVFVRMAIFSLMARVC